MRRALTLMEMLVALAADFGVDGCGGILRRDLPTRP